MYEIMRLRFRAFAVSTKKNRAAAMNWARGLFRLWLVLSVLWIALCAVVMRPDREFVEYNDNYARAKELAGDLKQEVSRPDFTEEQNAKLLELKERQFLAVDRTVQRNRSDLVFFFVIGPGVSAALFAIGLSLLWALRGFKGQSQ